MSDYDKPFRGDLSVKGFNKEDCEKKRVQLLLVSAHQEQLAKGEGVFLLIRNLNGIVYQLIRQG
jgi:hypothetical protein